MAAMTFLTLRVLRKIDRGEARGVRKQTTNLGPRRGLRTNVALALYVILQRHFVQGLNKSRFNQM
jgi:hypothetical protein